ncbi:MAG TPA: efflux RND transporter permease subunit, partial [Gemmatimonadaceae bacterium]|nr:efflux RND transporter permease subunit [Gemmatimonadaceae bacterium]
MRLADLLTAQRRLIYLAVGLLSVAGLWRARTTPSAIYPELTFPRITIVAEGSSLGARQQAFSVTRPIEEAVSTIPGVTRVTSRSIRGGTEISITFTSNTDMTYALQLTQARANQVRSQLP